MQSLQKTKTAYFCILFLFWDLLLQPYHSVLALLTNQYSDILFLIPIVKVIASPAYRIPTRREFRLINFSDKAVVDVYLLFPAAIAFSAGK